MAQRLRDTKDETANGILQYTKHQGFPQKKATATATATAWRISECFRQAG